MLIKINLKKEKIHFPQGGLEPATTLVKSGLARIK